MYWNRGIRDHCSRYRLVDTVVAPRNSQYAYHEVLQRHVRPETRWLDIGCGRDVVPEWFPPHLQNPLLPEFAVGVDGDRQALQRNSRLTLKIHADIQRLPFADDCFDLVTANMVVEHIERPALLFDEVARVLRPGGWFVFHTPNSTGYTTALTRLIPGPFRSRLAGLLHGRDAADVYPTFYRANSARTIRRLASNSSLLVTNLAFVHSSPQFAALPILRTLELIVITILSIDQLVRFRACLLVKIEKARGLERSE